MGGSPVPRAEINRGYIASPRDGKEGAVVVQAPMSHDSACNTALRPAMMVNWYYRLVELWPFDVGMPRLDRKSGAWNGQLADSGVREGRRSTEWPDDVPARSRSAFSI